ncbi:quinone oxidoreductase family protein [Kitasatospora cineracea]|uniref:NADPH:quinone reductase-like Zn-dependent oxidoreductase n=1 Tax=Kitasatospora cineracea TaxID=88074 RepID=A0A3N4RZY9_9ACTN|nr:quinone oxidoreductase [Kitasatospora cineracea]ROR35406.1 NADPH:quinone reductase-like Zn-dependent oxidoreductase [Kitasatospora cineracea]RPE29664.1 NADPH:quinone reductase-like Zn-dependent oxidoreductase [Kitasatospora cineracea]
MQAIRIEEHGGPEVMRWTELPDPVPGPGEVLVRSAAVGVNYMDVGARAQGGPGWAAPAVLGAEGAGYVTALGAGVEELAVGDRVAWFYHPGSYAELLAVPVAALVKVPDGVSDEVAGGLLMQGLTANHLTTETYPVAPGSTAVVHAAAGGVGQLLTQLVKARGGSVIGLVSRAEKAAVAERAGADHVLVHSGGGFEQQVRELTGGRGADVVYDGGGADTFASSQLSLRPHGVHAYYGPFMGVPTLRPTDLPNSILLSYPVVHHHVATRADLVRRTGELFDLVLDGRLTQRITGRYPLADAARAHADLESRRTTGKLILLP